MSKCPEEPSGLNVVVQPSMQLLGPHPSLCQTCATDHHPEEPHNQQSLYYQMAFHQQHGRWPTWEDAMAHCDEATRELWTKELKRLGAWDGAA